MVFLRYIYHFHLFLLNYHLSPYPEIGYVRGTLTEEGRKDPFLKDFPDHFDMGTWHFYMPGLNHNCEVLAYSDGCPHQIIRFGKYAYGFQTHMEMNKELAKTILDSEKGQPKITGPYIRSEEEILSHDYTEMNKLVMVAFAGNALLRAGKKGT